MKMANKLKKKKGRKPQPSMQIKLYKYFCMNKRLKDNTQLQQLMDTMLSKRTHQQFFLFHSHPQEIIRSLRTAVSEKIKCQI